MDGPGPVPSPCLSNYIGINELRIVDVALVAGSLEMNFDNQNSLSQSQLSKENLLPGKI